MKFKVEKGTETYDKFEELFERIDKYDDEAIEMRNSLGFKKHCLHQENVGGGIYGIFSSEKIEGFKKHPRHHSLWIPKIANKEIIEKFKSLPVVTRDEYNDVIGFEQQFVGLTLYRTYGLKKSEVEDCYLITMGENVEFKPSKDLIEIVGSEYKRLSEKSTKEQEV